MAQIFHRSTNFISKVSVFFGALLAALGLGGVMGLARAPYLTNQNVTREQPIQFSHKHHVGDDGIDCRYCHTAVESSATAGVPPTKTCMNCHSVLFNNAGYLEPVRESYRTDKSIEWIRVHRLADYVYFNHSIHINKGVGCSTCHGQINQMPLVFQATRRRFCVRATRFSIWIGRLRPIRRKSARNWQPNITFRAWRNCKVAPHVIDSGWV
jgi:hypothetical protein